MPISLPPISRRQFLARTLLAGASLCAGQNLFGAARARDEHSWALFSDTHIAANAQEVVRATNMTDNFIAVRSEVLNLPKRPAGVLISGDLAFSTGEPGDYQQLAEQLEPLRQGGLPIHLALGNHDERSHFQTALRPRHTEKVEQKDVLLVKAARANWFILDSLRITKDTPGQLGETQLAWLAKTLDKNKRKPAIIVIHHNPDDSGKFGLMDTSALWAILRPRKQVKAYIYGHSHRWNLEQDESGIHLINLPPTAYVFQAERPNGWVHAHLEKAGVKLELRCLNVQHPDHGKIVDLKWRV